MDTSALLKLYVQETGSEAMATLAGRTRAEFAISSLTLIEFRCAIRQRQRLGDLDGAAVAAILAHFQQRAARSLIRQRLTDAVFELASALADRRLLRALDALQLAACIALRASSTEPPIFVCSDRRLLEAATAEGVPVLDPTA